MRFYYIFLLLSVFGLASCTESRLHEHKDWEKLFADNGITNGCFMVRDHTHDALHYYNREQCLRRFSPASTFKIFNSLVALETAIAPDDQLLIKWDSVVRERPELNKDLTMREAFKVSSLPYYQEIARRVGREYLQHYLDTVQYGNRRIGPKADEFWINDTLRISADEQVGFLKKLYFDELPFSERSQRIVRSMMLQEEKPNYKLYYKTGTMNVRDSTVYWIVGFAEKIDEVVEPEKSMNKSNIRTYPYFFAQNFIVASNDTSRNWFQTRITVLKEVLKNMEVIK